MSPRNRARACILVLLLDLKLVFVLLASVGADVASLQACIKPRKDLIVITR
jgi:hypothetical protein